MAPQKLLLDDCHFAGILSLSPQTSQETSLNRRDQIFQWHEPELLSYYFLRALLPTKKSSYTFKCAFVALNLKYSNCGETDCIVIILSWKSENFPLLTTDSFVKRKIHFARRGSGIYSEICSIVKASAISKAFILFSWNVCRTPVKANTADKRCGNRRRAQQSRFRETLNIVVHTTYTTGNYSVM